MRIPAAVPNLQTMHSLDAMIASLENSCHNGVCDDCPTGFYQNQTGQSFCFGCSLGYTTPNLRSTSFTNCTFCQSSKSWKDQGSNTGYCTQCQGLVAKFGRETFCVECQAGKYADKPNGQCVDSHDGKWINQVNSSNCFDCPSFLVVRCPLGSPVPPVLSSGYVRQLSEPASIFPCIPHSLIRGRLYFSISFQSPIFRTIDITYIGIGCDLKSPYLYILGAKILMPIFFTVFLAMQNLALVTMGKVKEIRFFQIQFSFSISLSFSLSAQCFRYFLALKFLLDIMLFPRTPQQCATQRSGIISWNSLW
jgi:hypothetical protein